MIIHTDDAPKAIGHMFRQELQTDFYLHLDKYRLIQKQVKLLVKIFRNKLHKS